MKTRNLLTRVVTALCSGFVGIPVAAWAASILWDADDNQQCCSQSSFNEDYDFSQGNPTGAFSCANVCGSPGCRPMPLTDRAGPGPA